MDGIVAVAFLVGCASNLLICQDLPTPLDRFADMEACGAALPGLIRREGQDSNLPVVMGKCSLMLWPSMPPQNAPVRRHLAVTGLIHNLFEEIDRGPQAF